MSVLSFPLKYTTRELELYYDQSDVTRSLIELIIKKEPSYFHDLYKLVNGWGGLQNDILAQIVEIKYQMLVHNKTEEEAQKIALETAQRIEKEKNLLQQDKIPELEQTLLKNVLTYDEKQHLKAILTRYFPNKEIRKQCFNSNTLQYSKHVTTESCCIELYTRITSAVNNIKDLLRTKSLNLNEITLTDVAPSLPSYTIDMNDPKNFFKYLKKCLDEHRITDQELLNFSYNIKWLARFLDMEPQWLSIFQVESEPEPKPEPEPKLEPVLIIPDDSINEALIGKVKTELLSVCSKYKNIKFTQTNGIIISKQCIDDDGNLMGDDKCCPTVKKFVTDFLDDTTKVFDKNHIPHDERQLKLYFEQEPIIDENFFELLDARERPCMDDITTMKFAKLIGYTLPTDTRYGFYKERTVDGGSYSRRKHRTSKKSCKSRGRGRRHRRSSYNKKHHVKRHTKRHTKRYRNRK
jgi:hypothetical protein